MQVGTEFTLDLAHLVKPLIGRLVEVPIEGEDEKVLARITGVADGLGVLRAVSSDTKE